MTTRELEAVAALGSSSWAVLAQIMPDGIPNPDPMLNAVRYAAELSPTAILAYVCFVLWKRYTTREDKLAELQRENVAALQRVADALERFERERI